MAMRFTMAPSRIFSASARSEPEDLYFEASTILETELTSFAISVSTDLSFADDLIFETSRFMSAISFLRCCKATRSCISATLSTIWFSISDLTFSTKVFLTSVADDCDCPDICPDSSFDFSIRFCVVEIKPAHDSPSTFVCLIALKSSIAFDTDAFSSYSNSEAIAFTFSDICF